MKIKFTFGDTVTIDLIQNTYGSYIYIPKKRVTSPLEFFSIKDAIIFFSEFLPVKVYDKEEESLTFVVNIDYKNVGIAFYMSDEDKTNTVWIDYTLENKGFSDFLKTNRKEKDSIDDTIRYFIAFVDGKNKEFEYKGYTLKLGVIEERKGGYCEELNYKTYGEDEEANITKFKKYINWKITSIKKENSSHNHLLTQLDRLAKKDKENNFTPFELRGQLIVIYHLFGKILSLTLEDIHKLYFTRAEG